MATIPEALAIAIQHHQGGRLHTAEQIYRQILKADPNQADAFHLLGVVAAQVGKHEFAIEYIGRAIGLNGNAAAFHHNLGEAYRALSRIPEAVACYRRALELKPDYAEAQHSLWTVRGVLISGVPQTQGLIPDSVGDSTGHVPASKGIADQPPCESGANLSYPGGSPRAQTKRKYRICVIAPQGWAHYHCYREVALVLKYSFESLGFDCDLTLNELDKDRLNILLGYHNLSYTAAFKNKNIRYIPYQLEQLSQNAPYYSDRSKEVLANAFEVWDYAKENIAFLESLGIQAKYLPVGYHEKLEVIRRDRDKDIDILFFGAISDRRRTFFQKITETTVLKLKLLFCVYGRDRDEWIARSRIVINLHQFPQLQVLEAPRVAYLLNNRCFLLCENASNNPYATVGLEFSELGDMVEKCHSFIASPRRAEDLAQGWYRQFKTDYNMVELLRNVL